MVKLRVYRRDIKNDDGEHIAVYSADLFNKVSLVVGNSGTGKTYLCDLLDNTRDPESSYYYDCYDTSKQSNITVVVLKGIVTKELLDKCNEGSLVVLDETASKYMRSSKDVNIERYKLYFLILDRTLQINYEINVNAVYVVKHTIYKGARVSWLSNYMLFKHMGIDDVDISDIKYMLSEDTRSGADFWRSSLSKVELIEYPKTGDGSIPQNIERALKEHDGTIMVALDYDRCSSIMHKIISSDAIDKSRVYFIPLESFEEIICNSEFVLSKFPELRDFVVDYKNHMDYRNNSTGKYFGALLNLKLKVLSPLKTHEDKNAFKFYSKGMKNFRECFINDCCDFGKEDCKLNYNGSKKEAMLANKFEGLRKFI